jgi:hypothetical protein
MSKVGTLSYEDIYGAGTLDTVPASEAGQTQQKANPNNSEVTGAVTRDRAGIWNMKGNLLGQPLTVWFGMLLLLVAIKYMAEKEA